MANYTNYTSRSGWLVQDAPGRIALDSLRPCAAHAPVPQRGCERCDDGPMVEDGYYLGDYDGAGYPIYDSSDRQVAVAHYQSTDGRLVVIAASGYRRQRTPR
jgi:hypothetical protein